MVIITDDAGDATATDAGDADPVDPSECSIDCDDGIACTRDEVTLEGPTCASASCTHSQRTQCVDGDGCCPSGCDNPNDSDCAAVCGDHYTGGAETCDGDCPTDPSECASGRACQVAYLTGTPEQCDVQCAYRPKTSCVDDDGCCPSGCTVDEDSDCLGSCGVPYAETIDHGEVTDTAMTVDSRGRIYVVYVRKHATHSELVFATNESGIWTTEQLLDVAPIRLGGLEMDDADQLHLAYSKHTRYGSGFPYRVSHSQRISGGRWKRTTLDTPGKVGPNSLAIARVTQGRIVSEDADKIYYSGVDFDQVAFENGVITGVTGDERFALTMAYSGTSPVLFLTGEGGLYEQAYDVEHSGRRELVELASPGPDNSGHDWYYSGTDVLVDSRNHLRFTYAATDRSLSPPRHSIIVNKPHSSFVSHLGGPSSEQDTVFSVSRAGQQTPFSRLHLQVDSSDHTHLGWEEELDDGSARAGYATDRRGAWHTDYLSQPMAAGTESFAVGGDDRPYLLFGGLSASSSGTTNDHLTLVHLCPPPSCTPDCDGRVCGPDGCGGSCGTCAAPGGCRGNECPCQPDCSGKSCGDDGCGGSCGTCAGNDTCTQAGQCICQADCTGKACGDDGCGGSCGSCATGQSCSPQGQCCTPDCTGKVCGDDGCGGSCGSCGAGKFCNAQGQCDDYTQPCDPVSQSICGSGQKCTWDGSSFVCVADGSTPAGASCYAGVCQAGSICVGADFEVCRQFCYSDSDCNPDGRCVIPLSGTSSVEVCTNGCDPLTSGSCPSGQGCYVANLPGATEVTDCREAGVKFEGQSCTVADDCSFNLTCAGGQCRKVCSAFGGTCATGACQQVSGWTTYGVCPL